MSTKNYLKIPIALLFALSMLLGTSSCQRKKINRLSYINGYRNGHGYSNNNSINAILSNIPCLGAYGQQSQNRVSYYLSAVGSYHNGYFSVATGGRPFQPLGSAPNTNNRFYLGLSVLGDVVTIHPLNDGRTAHVALYICPDAFFIPGRQLIQAQTTTGRIVLKSRPNCSMDEVSAMNLQVYLGTHAGIPGSAAPVSFASFAQYERSLCQ